jgi:hypothetical protein
MLAPSTIMRGHSDPSAERMSENGDSVRSASPIKRLGPLGAHQDSLV